jgi:CopG family nickel-responsive transcriptional regulator
MMTKHKNDLNIIAVSLPGKIATDMDSAVSKMGYMSRSELIRDAVREFLKDAGRLDEVTGNIQGVVTILYNHDSGQKISQVRHRYMGIFKSFMHSDFDIDDASCCEVLIYSGKAADVRKAFYELKSIKGVNEANIYIASRNGH